MPGFEYKTNLDSVITALKDANTCTATAFLSNSLTTAIDNKNIYNRNPEVYEINGRDLPAIFVRIPNATEEYASQGPTGSTRNQKFKTLVYDVIGLYPSQGMTNNEEDRLEEIYKFARNIEAVFQENYRLSNTALWVNPRATDFQGPFGLEDGTLFKSVVVEVEARYLFK